MFKDKIFLEEESEILEKVYNPGLIGIGTKKQVTRKEMPRGAYYEMNSKRLTFTGTFE